MHQGPTIQYILALSSWLNNVFGHQSPESICKFRCVRRPRNIYGFDDCWGIAAKFELEDVFQLVIPSSCLLNNSCGSICIVSLLTLTADVLTVTAWYFS